MAAAWIIERGRRDGSERGEPDDWRTRNCARSGKPRPRFGIASVPVTSLTGMQDRLFNSPGGQLDLTVDPYDETRETARRLAVAHGVPEEEAFDLLLGYGTEEAVRRTLKQRWWRGDVPRLDEAA